MKWPDEGVSSVCAPVIFFLFNLFAEKNENTQIKTST